MTTHCKLEHVGNKELEHFVTALFTYHGEDIANEKARELVARWSNGPRLYKSCPELQPAESVIFALASHKSVVETLGGGA